ncbi:MAG TPA: hypothetical protein VIV56_07265 [Gemmatimonadales bacterium]
MSTLNAKSNYLEEALINAVLRNTSFTSPSNVYVALFTAAPGETGGGTEVSGGSYARVTVSTSGGWDAPSQVSGFAQTQNTADITFTTASASWGTVTSFGLFDNSTGGNLLYYGDLDASKVVGSGDTLKFLAGELKIAES